MEKKQTVMSAEQFLKILKESGDFRKLGPYIIKEEVRFGDLAAEDIHLGDIVFEKEVFFDTAEILMINFGESSFFEYINFGDSKIGELYFDKSSPYSVYFGSMKVGNLYFDDASFKKTVDFGSVDIEGDLDFGNPSFKRIDCRDNYRLRQDLHMAFPGVQIFGNYKKVPFSRS